MTNENMNPLDDTTDTDHIIRGAFDRLRVDAGKVNTMTALHAHEAKTIKPRPAGLGPLVVGFAAVALLIFGAAFLLGANNSSIVDIDAPVATQPESPEVTPDDGAAPVAIDDEAAEGVSTGSSFDDLPGCGTTESNARDIQSSIGDLVDIESFDDGTCVRTVFVFDDAAAFNPDEISVAPAAGGGIDISFPTDQEVRPVVAEDRSVGFAAQGIYWDGGYYAHVNHGQAADLSTVAVLTDPTRIVVDTTAAVAPTAPVFGTDIVLPRDLGEVTTPLTVTGHVHRGVDPVVELRQAPSQGAAPGSGELVIANWSGIEAIGDPEVTGSGYTYTSNPFGWYAFEFTIDGIPAGNYELVYLDPSADGNDVDLVVPFSVTDSESTDGATDSNTLETATIASLPANFVPELDQLRQMTSAPIVLPTEFAGEPTENLFLTIIDAEDGRYEAVIGLAPDCFGSTACSLGTVSVAEFVGDPVDLGGQKVELANGIQADLFASTCGATCSDTLVIWRDNTYAYSFGLKGASDVAAIDFASSARIIN